jgi:hypothetical protein
VCAERFIQTIVEKAQAICLEACIPQNWWEFAVNYAVHIYNHTLLKCSSNDYKTPFKRLHHTKPDVAHLKIFGCRAYVFLPEDMRSNNLSPRSELMTFIGLVKGTKGYILMRSPNNNVFTAIQALFDETLFPKCPDMRCLGYTPVGLTPDDLQDEHNGPLDDENEDYGGGLPPIPYCYPRAPQGPPAYQQPPPPPLLVSSGRGFPLWSKYENNEDVLSYKSKTPTPPVPREPTPPVPQEPTEYFDYDEDYGKVPYTWHEGTSRFLFEPDRVPRPFATPQRPQRLNFPEAPPSPSRQPAVEQEQAPATINPLRCSGRIRQPVFNPDNVYGNRPPVDILGDSDNDNVLGLQRNQSPGPSKENTGNIVTTTPKAQILQDGGAKLINFLLRAAVSSADARKKILDVSKVCEWHFRDLMHLPKAMQEE